MPLSPQRSASPEVVPTVLVFGDRQDLIRVEASMTTPWSEVAAVAPRVAPAIDFSTKSAAPV
ncbi:MAG TPA: hypothetical protein VIQ28_04465, partial [Burkholderiales bacterium]